MVEVGAVYNQLRRNVRYQTLQGKLFEIGGASLKNTKSDRRSLRTRQLLSTALVELMLHKRYEAITVQDIIDRANVGRSTFYAHYLDKDDLLISDFTRVLDALSDHMHQHKPGELGRPPSLAPFLSMCRRIVSSTKHWCAAAASNCSTRRGTSGCGTISSSILGSWCRRARCLRSHCRS